MGRMSESGVGRRRRVGRGECWRSKLGRISESGMEGMPEKQVAEEEKENDGYHK